MLAGGFHNISGYVVPAELILMYLRQKQIEAQPTALSKSLLRDSNLCCTANMRFGGSYKCYLYSSVNLHCKWILAPTFLFHCEIELYVISCKSPTAYMNSICYVSIWAPPQQYMSPQLWTHSWPFPWTCLRSLLRSCVNKARDFFKHCKSSHLPEKAPHLEMTPEVSPCVLFCSPNFYFFFVCLLQCLCYHSNIPYWIKSTIGDLLATCGQQKHAERATVCSSI